MHMLMLLAAFAATPASAPSPPVPIRPEAWIGYKDYPPSALRASEQGTVWFEGSVDPTGKFYDCRILVGSGHVALDEQTCQLMHRRAEFKPAKDQQGIDVASTFRRRTSWWLPSSSRRMPSPSVWKPSDMIVEIAQIPHGATPNVDVLSVETGTGSVEHCSVVGSSGNEQLDRVACAQLRKAKFEPLRDANGAPMRALRERRIEFRAGR